ncbi:MAG: zinc-ribbon domain-containing protein, partial [Turicibacter sp.]
DDHQVLIDKIAGIKQQFTIDDVKERTLSMLDQLLMRWISKEGKDLFNLQANAYEIARGIRQELDMDLIKIGLTVTDFTVSSFTYPENIQKMVEKSASYDMVGDLDKYQKVSMIDSMVSNPNSQMAGMAQAGVGMAMGVEMMKQMGGVMNHTNQPVGQPMPQTGSNAPACSGCGHTLPEGAKFCVECGTKVQVQAVPTTKFCGECGSKVEVGAKFCNECGNKLG